MVDNRLSYVLSAKTCITGIVPKIKKVVGSFQHHSFPMDPNYCPEIGKASLISSAQASIYCMMVGTTMWEVTLGRYDIQYIVSQQRLEKPDGA